VPLTPSRPLGLARIGASIAILLELRGSADSLLRLAEPQYITTPYVEWAPAITEPLAMALIGLWLVSGLAFMVGWWSRLAGTVLTLTLASVVLLDQQLYSNHLYLMVIVAGLLTAADSGAAISLDALQRGSRESVPSWPVWLLRAQVSIVYGFAALSKVNLTYLSGSVVASYLRREGPLAVPEAWRSIEPMMVLAILSICLEAFVAVGLWLPRWRPAALVAGLMLHIGISAWLSPTFQITVFSLLMLPLYLVFLETRPERVVVWDDGCGFCGTWVRWFRRLDWLRALRFVPRSQLASAGVPVSEDAAARALQLVTPRRVRGGFAAVTGVAELLPISFLWAPLLRLPPVAAIGDRVYQRVAARRLCDIGKLPAERPAQA
jgi:predicted DCC family thiol-disulfide oxidoreductase YuxK